MPTTTRSTSAVPDCEPGRAPTRSEPTVGYPRRWQLLPVVLSAMFMAMFDFFVVNVAGPSLQHDLHASSAGLELVISAYTFTYAATVVIGGRLGDLIGPRAMFLWGMSAFTAASVLCGVAPTVTVLIIARLAQGFTAAAMVPQVLGLITTVFPPHERAKAMGYFGLTIGAGSVSGQVLGGVLLNWDLFHWGWRTIFLVNLPIGIAMVTLGLRLLPRLAVGARPRFDVPGTVGITAGIGLILVPLVLGRDAGWPVWTWVCFAAAAPVLAVTLWWERHLAAAGGAPLVSLELFDDRTYAAGFATGALYLGTFTGFVLALTLLMQGGLGASPLTAGLAFGPLGVAFATSSVLGKGVAGRHPGHTATAGTLISLTGMASLAVVLAALGGHVAIWALIPSMILVGGGNGLVIPTLLGASMHRVPMHRVGSAAGLLTTAQQFGNAGGVAVMGVIFFTVLGSAPHRADFVGAAASVMTASAVLLAVIAVLTLLLPRSLAPTR